MPRITRSRPRSIRRVARRNPKRRSSRRNQKPRGRRNRSSEDVGSLRRCIAKACLSIGASQQRVGMQPESRTTAERLQLALAAGALGDWSSEAAMREETRTLEMMNRIAIALASTLDIQSLLQTVTDAATRVSGAQFGAFFYNTHDKNGDAYMLYTLSGAPRAAFEKFG